MGRYVYKLGVLTIYYIKAIYVPIRTAKYIEILTQKINPAQKRARFTHAAQYGAFRANRPYIFG